MAEAFFYVLIFLNLFTCHTNITKDTRLKLITRKKYEESGDEAQ